MRASAAESGQEHPAEGLRLVHRELQPPGQGGGQGDGAGGGLLGAQPRGHAARRERAALVAGGDRGLGRGADALAAGQAQRSPGTPLFE